MADSFIQILAKRSSANKTKLARLGSEDQQLAKAGLTRYSVYCLPALRKRARRALLLLGLEPIEGSNHQSNEWSEYIRIPTWTPGDSLLGTEVEKLQEKDFAPYLIAGTA
ncbi:hypothetical protein HO173_006173 [Letharia columbiana]|uniref:Uncharacterized protein n=1 Tax=Letharia columbiana TaxID=112416 RepID=A0A8H6L4P2_9LECA|nr:uncharacterized protein HO173_006173 [Letharia columbiana]KAF6235490.1 hypothetical protein HO173_006173 [Letharia columbiana]